MKYKVLALAMLIFVVACNQSQDTSQKHDVKQNQRESKSTKGFSIKKFHYQQPEDMTPYVKAKVDYFQIEDDSDLANVVNNRILFTYLDQQESIPQNPNEMLDKHFRGIEKEVKDLLKEFNDTELLPYVFEYKAEPVINNGRLFSMKQKFYSYTGGAHGMYGELYFNYDAKTAHEILLLSLFSPDELKKLNVLGEQIFRKQEKLKEDEDLKEAGYFFDNGFSLTPNFLIAKDGLYFYYAPYEIGPYALGAINLFIPYSKIKELLPEHKKLYYYLN